MPNHTDYIHGITKAKTVSFFGRIGYATGKLVVRLPIVCSVIWLWFWLMKDNLPEPILWFMAGMIVNDFWNDTAESKGG